MDAYKQAEKALCVYGEMRRSQIEGGEKTRAFLAQINAALGTLSVEDQTTVQALYIKGMTQEEAAWATDCDPTTISRRKRRILERLALHLYPDEYLQEKGL